MTRLAEVLTPVKDLVRVDDPKTAMLISVKLHGRGAVRRFPGDGKAPKPFVGNRGHTGQFVFSRIWARRGAMALIPSELDGVVVTNEFPLFMIDHQRLDPIYFTRLVQTSQFLTELERVSAGASGQNRVTETAFLRLDVSLPSLPEQRRIAAILDHADALRAKRRQVLAHLDALTQAIFHDMFSETMSPRVTLGDRLDFLTSGSRGWAKYYADEGEKFIRIQNVGRGELRLNDMAYVNAPPTAEARRTLVQAGDVLLSITADLGRTAVVTEELGHAYISQHLAILRAPSFVPEFLSAYLQSPDGQRQIMKKDRGATKAGLNFNDVRSIMAPAPSRAMQHQFAARAAAVSGQRLVVQRMLVAEDELFASLLSCAFRGEL